MFLLHFFVIAATFVTPRPLKITIFLEKMHGVIISVHGIPNKIFLSRDSNYRHGHVTKVWEV